MTQPAWRGGRFGHARCIRADNASPMTLDGTNTWILRAEEAGRSIVIDPGPLDALHLDAVAEVAGHVSAVLLTHGHLDHSEGARRFAERVGCGVRALDPAFVYGDEGLHDGDVIDVDGLEVRVIATPGHTSDSLSFVLPEDDAVLTGDTVLGRGTSVVAHPDGALGAYLGSLHRLRDLAADQGLVTVLPGHGPVLGDALAVLDHYLRHRAERLDQVRDAVRALTSASASRSSRQAAGAAETSLDPMDVVRLVYAEVDERLWPAAELSVRAQLDFLRTEQR